MGATAGRTTLNGEGLQHQDGHSLLMASTVPGCRAWDPAYAYELATIIRHGINEMWGENMDVIHYVMLYNENQQQLPKPEGADYGIIKGAYKVQESGRGLKRLKFPVGRPLRAKTFRTKRVNRFRDIYAKSA